MITKNLELFGAGEITVTLPKRYLERLHSLLKNNSQQTVQSLKEKDSMNIQDRVEKMLEHNEDRDILVYLDWVLKQNDSVL
jgi:hypothetical protein